MDDPALAFQRRSRAFLIAATVVLAAVVAVILLTLFVLVTRGPTMRVESLERLGLIWAPALFYLWALWTLRGLFSALSRGGLNFQPLIAQALSRIGWALALGAGVSVVAAPIVLSLGGPHAFGGFAVFVVPPLTLGVVGLALIALAGLLRRASAIEAEATKLRTTLKEFV